MGFDVIDFFTKLFALCLVSSEKVQVKNKMAMGTLASQGCALAVPRRLRQLIATLRYWTRRP